MSSIVIAGMLKEQCHRCGKPVYPTDKIGPLKDAACFHRGCFKCYICGTRLALKTYCNNRNDINDQEVYCSNHVPVAGPHDLPPDKRNAMLQQMQVPNGLDRSAGSRCAVDMNGNSPNNFRCDAGLADLKIAHAIKATKVAKPYPKIEHGGARYVVDYDAQTRLELLHREDEDRLYQAFDEKRAREQDEFERETREEWEHALTEFARKYQAGHAVGDMGMPRSKDELIRQLTIKRERRLETLHSKRRERERQKTAELVDRQAREMLDLFKQARNDEPTVSGHGANGGSSSGTPVNGGATPPGRAYPSSPPPPAPPVCSKRDVCPSPLHFEHIDEAAVSMANEDIPSFTHLIRALTYNASNDMDKARAIYRWITVKNLNAINFNDNLDSNTPMACGRGSNAFKSAAEPSPMQMLRGIKYGTESYHVLFKRLCSYAGLHCVVIKGFSKSAGYQPGFSFDDQRFRNTWNAVYVDGSWRFVQCNWGARHLVNQKDRPPQNGHRHHHHHHHQHQHQQHQHQHHNHHSRQGQAPCSSTSDGQTSSSSTTAATTATGAAAAANLRYEYDDHYFCTDPEEFIYEFFPLDPAWQLLPDPISLRDFEQLPFVRSLFFRYRLAFADPTLRSTIHADRSGTATVAVQMSDDTAESLIFHYNLKQYDSDETEVEGVSLKRFVMQSVEGRTVIFCVHVPTTRPLLLDVFANAVSSDHYLTGQPIKFKSVCKFRIVCDRVPAVMVPLPECASGEWGPAKAARLFKLLPLSHPNPIINAPPQLDVRFRMSRPLVDFVAALHRNGVEQRALARCCSVQVRGDTVLVRVAFPEPGQYGLDLYTRDSELASGNGNQTPNNGSMQMLTHCCKYLIHVRLPDN